MIGTGALGNRVRDRKRAGEGVAAIEVAALVIEFAIEPRYLAARSYGCRLSAVGAVDARAGFARSLGLRMHWQSTLFHRRRAFPARRACHLPRAMFRKCFHMAMPKY